MRYGLQMFGSLVPMDEGTRTRKIDIQEILVKAKDDAVAATSAEAANAASRAIGRLVKKPIAKIPDVGPVATAKTPAPKWFKYGLYGAAGLFVFMLFTPGKD